MRTLLHHVSGATSFEYLRMTGHGTQQLVVHETFKDACRGLGLPEDNTEWDQCLQEADTFATPRALRQLFASLLAFSDVTNPRALWDKFRDSMCADFFREARTSNPSRALDEAISDQALIDLHVHLR